MGVPFLRPRAIGMPVSFSMRKSCFWSWSVSAEPRAMETALLGPGSFDMLWEGEGGVFWGVGIEVEG